MPILTTDQIRDLHSRYVEVVNFINTKNEGHPNGLRIKQVQIPSSMTQSLAFHFIVNNPNYIGLNDIIQERLREGNNRTYDLIYSIENKKINIEVKATGTNDFQRFRPHSLTTSYIFWLNFKENIYYDIAIFNPNILTPKPNGEVDITWNQLTQLQNITIIQNRRIE